MISSQICKVCSQHTVNKKALTNHVNKAHKLSARDYVIGHLYGGVVPRCSVESCPDEPRYVALTFKKFCKSHARLAESEAGKKHASDYIDNKPIIELDFFVRLMSLGAPSDKKVQVIINDLKSRAIAKSGSRAAHVAAKSADTKLIQFFSDEWRDKRPVCESIIRNAFGANVIKLHARDCDVREITAKESRPFIDANHVGGATRARHHLGLFHPTHGLVGCVTIRVPIQKKWGNVCELARMCFLGGVSVRGGASKLLQHVQDWSVINHFEGVLSYAELRFGDGAVYEKCGFACVGEALNNYWYTDGERRYDRFKFRAQPGKPEKIVADENGVWPTWGCGNKIYLKKVVPSPVAAGVTA